MSGILVSGALWMSMACSAGEKYGLCRTMVAVTKVESSGCKYLVGDHGRSLGCDQVSIKAARAVGYHVTRKQLLRDAPLNMRIAAAYMARCIVRMGTWERGLVAYNTGENTAIKLSWRQIERFYYVRRIKEALPPPLPPKISTELVSWQVEAGPYPTAQWGLDGGGVGLLGPGRFLPALRNQTISGLREPD